MQRESDFPRWRAESRLPARSTSSPLDPASMSPHTHVITLKVPRREMNQGDLGVWLAQSPGPARLLLDLSEARRGLCSLSLSCWSKLRTLPSAPSAPPRLQEAPVRSLMYPFPQPTCRHVFTKHLLCARQYDSKGRLVGEAHMCCVLGCAQGQAGPRAPGQEGDQGGLPGGGEGLRP